jgi:CDP-diacylglycerol--serine O-phosphatidyltransferase
MKQHIPNAITALNLVCGCLAVISALNGQLIAASYLIGVAAVFDFFDGMVARLLNVQSPIGKELDSLADVVSFGVAPGMILYMISGSCFAMGPFCVNTYVVLLIPVFAAFRLAKFNIDTRQSDSFIGLPTPAMSIFIASLPLILEHDSYGLSSAISSRYFLIITPFVLSHLMISEIPLLALKFKNFSWQDNYMRYVLVMLCLTLILILGYTGIALSVLAYVFLSAVNNMISNNKSI